jgi:hypothetical protein
MLYKFVDKNHSSKVVTIESDDHHLLKDAVAISIYQYPEEGTSINHISAIIDKHDIRKALSDYTEKEIRNILRGLDLK